MRILTREQIPAFLEAARPERLAALFHVAIASGAREGELLALRWSHVDWTRGAIRIARTLQRTSAGLSFAECKTRSSERTVAVGPQRWRRSARTASARPRSVSVSDSAKGPRTASCSRARLARRSTLATSYAARSAGRSSGPRFPTCRSIRLDTRTRRWRSRRGVHGRPVADRRGHATPSLVMNHLRPRHPGDASGRDRRPRARRGELMRSALLHFLLQNDPAEAGGVVVCADLLAFLGEPGGIRTHDQGIKSPLLYR